MRIDRDLPIPMDDGIVLRADVFRPVEAGRFPVLITYGPYGKNLSFQKGYPEQWQALVRDHPEAVTGSTNKYQCWETVDPEKWVPDGYAVVRVDSRGAGCSPGVLDVLSPRETRDFDECIEWAADQPWSNGKIGLLGISYYAINQWMVAGLKPPHLAAMLPWEGAGDHYRDWLYHGGIFCEFGRRWYRKQVAPLKRGLLQDPATDASATAAPDFPGEDPAGNPYRRSNAHPLIDDWHRGRSADWSKVTVPFLSAASWGGQVCMIEATSRWHCRYARERGAQRVLGIDISRRMLERAKMQTKDVASNTFSLRLRICSSVRQNSTSLSVHSHSTTWSRSPRFSEEFSSGLSWEGRSCSLLNTRYSLHFQLKTGVRDPRASGCIGLWTTKPAGKNRSASRFVFGGALDN